jgi:HAD superfamily hydrolase (TIGR01509 family)
MKLSGAILHMGKGQRRIGVEDWMPVIRQLGVQAVIFDCDGTLVDSADAHFHAMQDAAEAQGLSMDRDWYDQRRGLGRVALFSEFKAACDGRFEVKQATADSIAAFSRHVPKIHAIAETADLLRRVRAANLAVAVGTNAEAAIARRSLQAAGLSGEISVLVSIDDTGEPKPSSAIFLCAARLLGVAPEHILVIEDSPLGIDAARAAGMVSFLLVEDVFKAE